MDRTTDAGRLTESEREVLTEVLESAYRELKQEIGRTEGASFKSELQQRREALRSVIEKLVGPAPIEDEL